ncbi:uncharacterized protein PFL1_01427 [Pseudozyma flocculosa PF-1]|uniref:Related to TAF9 - TFIID and SAGA subunit n=1 Tax=Pseudozyma flocculosa TaxID=84751 RepID=A0A5C3EWM5_9BASI|nr:uncharacterized protein PFL1_01427 [Pseudozyma flocculosa PF-1]EPQ31242.1 hypothetical protein PFL1_01427 [Pseudozyma flocculosa PF-1]SPO36260.1 related to TAF9 - TFIID and SAGA subunit [Pseudozyma flocculosa]
MPSATASSSAQHPRGADQASAGASATGFRGPVPRDARLMALILASMGVSNAEPEVLLQLLEFAHRYTYDVLSDALVYADHASTRQGTSSVSLDDVTLAIQSRVNYSFTTPPEKDTLLALATSLNSVPLPPISDRHGVRLPPQQHCLTNVNFTIIPNPPPPDYDEAEDDTDGNDAQQQSASEPSASTAAAATAATANGNATAAAAPSRMLVGDDDDYDDDDGDAALPPQAASTAAGPGTAVGAPREAGQAAEGDGDVSMSTDAAASQPPPPPPQQQQTQAPSAEQRGVKRSLDEDEDYD